MSVKRKIDCTECSADFRQYGSVYCYTGREGHHGPLLHNLSGGLYVGTAHAGNGSSKNDSFGIQQIDQISQSNADTKNWRLRANMAPPIPHEHADTMDIVGADFPDGFDVVIPCLLEGTGMVEAINAAAQNGRIVMYGCIGTCHKPVDFFKVHKKRLDILSTEPERDIDNRRYFDEGLRLILDGLVDTEEMITHVDPLVEVAQAFQLRNEHKGDTIHVMIDCEVK
jgi:threonine dehydrogenase-like Zn-dependent dehydrogenase